MKMLVVFEKTQRLRFIGHLDLMRTMQRALRRSDLPIRYSQGFNPHILLSFASPLSVGIVGKREIMEVPISGEMTTDEFRQRFEAVLPEALPCVEVRSYEDSHSTPMSGVYAAGYEITFDSSIKKAAEKVDEYLKQTEIPAIRHTKSGDKPCDLRPMIHELTMPDEYTICCKLDLRESSTCKPDLLCKSLLNYAGISDEDIPRCMIVRTQLFGNLNGELVPLEQL